ncbi:MAG: hypothetical protein RLZZ598_595 [Pseudomonadota bacterium]|jgi:3-hydroxyacyl-CoA dehydrogenase/enoyl-CoA hydratase/3-hydroxybutyryl-CoA epimerase
MNTMNTIRYDKDAQGIVTLTLDAPGQSANTMNAAYRASMGAAVQRLKDEGAALAGVILTSAKKTFFAGGDLNELITVTPDTLPEFEAAVSEIKQQLRTLETLGKPVVACIAGAAQGGGWEIALACHHRLALDDDRIQLGVPEVTLGLLPGAGGVVRTVRLLGLEKGLPLLLEGQQLKPKKAHALGLVHALAPDVGTMLAMAREFIRLNPKAAQPWDTKGYAIPGGSASHPKAAAMLPIAPAVVRARSQGKFPAPEAILSAAVEGTLVDFDTALVIEQRYFVQLVVSPVAKALIGTMWFQLNAIKAGGSRPKGLPPSKVNKVGVIGAGMMGAGIAYVSAAAGIDVVLKDVSQEAADKGKAYSRGLMDKKLARGQISADKHAALLARIHATADDADFAGCDLIIEAVFEERGLKARVTRAAHDAAHPDAVIASNTSTLPITGLAEAIPQAERFIGLHFFSPVDKMQLVEIIRGARTSDETLARAFDYVLQIRKIPIVVNDSRGFFTSRVFGTFVDEGIAMLAEGVAPALIENIATQAGMPVGPLAVADEVSLTLIQRVRKQTVADLKAEGRPVTGSLSEATVDRMMGDFKRPGRAGGGGFYDYPADGRKRLWPQLSASLAARATTIPHADVRDRILYVQALETVRALEEGVLNSSADANVGGIFGIGYAAWTGGPLQFINQVGLDAFIERSRYLAERYGARFAPPPRLLQMAAEGRQF